MSENATGAVAKRDKPVKQVHPIDEHMPKLPVRLTESDAVEVHTLAMQQTLGRKRMVHAWGLKITVNNGAVHKPILRAFPSDTYGTNVSRGELAAVLTALRWMERNADPATAIRIHSASEYVWSYLPEKLDDWLRESRRANLDLLKAIAPLMKRLTTYDVFAKAHAESPQRQELTPIVNKALAKSIANATADIASFETSRPPKRTAASPR